MIIRPVAAELFHRGRADRRTGTTYPTVAFRNFANAPKIPTFYPHSVVMFSYGSQNKQRLSPYRPTTSVFITKTEGVYWAVLAECLNIIQVEASLCIVKTLTA